MHLNPSGKLINNAYNNRIPYFQREIYQNRAIEQGNKLTYFDGSERLGGRQHYLLFNRSQFFSYLKTERFTFYVKLFADWKKTYQENIE